MDDLYKNPLALFSNELQSDHEDKRVNAVKNLYTIAVALPPEQLKSELVPFLYGRFST